MLEKERNVSVRVGENLYSGGKVEMEVTIGKGRRGSDPGEKKKRKELQIFHKRSPKLKGIVRTK